MATQPGHEAVVTLLAEFIGVAILAVIADMSDGFGKVAVGLMVGWLLIFIITHDTFLQGLTGKLNG